jgi:crotonobetaine/carnitine-CoA ligase
VLQHAQIVDCAAIGVPSGIEAGEDEVMLLLVMDDPRDVTVEGLLPWFRAQLPTFAVPRYVCFVDGLPRTPSGKVRKAELRGAYVAADAIDLHKLP